MTRLSDLAPRPVACTTRPDPRDYPEMLQPRTCSWPMLESSLDRAGRVPSPRLGRWMKAILVRVALFWLSVSLGWVVVRMACDGFARSWRRA